MYIYSEVHCVWFELIVFLTLIDVTLRSYDSNIGKKIKDLVCRAYVVEGEIFSLPYVRVLLAF